MPSRDVLDRIAEVCTGFRRIVANKRRDVDPLTGRCPMRTRLARLAILFATMSAALLVTAGAAFPAQAGLGLSPYCATTLHNAAAGTSSSCATQGPPPVACNTCGVWRSVEVVVSTGSADATLVCDGLTHTTHVDGPGTGSTGAWGGQNCTLTLTATADGTIAAATSTASYVIANV